MVTKAIGAQNFEVPTTAAIVQCSSWTFADLNGVPESETIGTDILIKFNGFAGETGSRIVVARNATLAQKQAAIRLRVNSLLNDLEPGNSLTNANIQIENIPT